MLKQSLHERAGNGTFGSADARVKPLTHPHAPKLGTLNPKETRRQGAHKALTPLRLPSCKAKHSQMEIKSYRKACIA